MKKNNVSVVEIEGAYYINDGSVCICINAGALGNREREICAGACRLERFASSRPVWTIFDERGRSCVWAQDTNRFVG